MYSLCTLLVFLTYFPLPSAKAYISMVSRTVLDPSVYSQPLTSFIIASLFCTSREEGRLFEKPQFIIKNKCSAIKIFKTLYDL